MNSTSLEIRALTPADAIAFRTLRLLAISDSPAAVWPTHDEEAGRTIPEIEARIQMTASQVARKLLSQATAHARARGVLQIHLCVNAENERARALYRSLGFKAYGVEPRALRVGDVYFDEEHMVLRLDE
jgi:hypothetical protein